MHYRYKNHEIVIIWGDETKLRLWQESELAVIEARVKLGRINFDVYDQIAEALQSNTIDLDWWRERDSIIRHDLNAFLEERMRFLSMELQIHFHSKGMTSYDPEEPAFVRMLLASIEVVRLLIDELKTVLHNKALQYRYSIMNGRTHGQEAELQTLGVRFLKAYKEVRMAETTLISAIEYLSYSKLSGAMGNYTGIDPDLEKEALRILGFVPFVGATQIMPRILYKPLAEALGGIVQVVEKIMRDIRLNARSPRPLMREPFGKKQKGSSAMPHKKNPITPEQLEGMVRMALGYVAMVTANVRTDEERAIEQSCVERVAWPDLFHVVTHSLKSSTRVLQNLAVYPDNMLLEIVESRGCYASAVAKDVLKEIGASHGLMSEDCYRIVQLAAFNAHEPNSQRHRLRNFVPTSLDDAESLLVEASAHQPEAPQSIRDIISFGTLQVSSELEADEVTVERWNKTLLTIFAGRKNLEKWRLVFSPTYLLRNERYLYLEILEE